MNDLRLVPASERSLEELFTTFNRAFEGYVGGEVRFTADSFSGFLLQQNANLTLSRLVLRTGRPIGLALVARRGWTSRLVVMGVVPEAQGQGVGQRLLRELLAEARRRGDRRFELEVIEQNPPALALYRKAGFQRVQRLLEFHAESPPAKPGTLEPCDIAEVAALLVRHGEADLPWQLSGFQVIHLGPPNLALRRNAAYALISDPEQAVIRLHGLLVAAGERRQGQGRRLLQALFAAYPSKRWHLPALCPERYAPFFEGLGFTRGPLSQFLMRLEL